MLDEPAPSAGMPFADLLGTVRDVVEEFSRHNGHPRFFGYVSSPGLPVAAMGSMIAAAFNINVTCWRSGPAAAEMELLCIRWLKEMLGYPGGWRGTAGQRRIDGEFCRHRGRAQRQGARQRGPRRHGRRPHAPLRLGRGSLLDPQGGRHARHRSGQPARPLRPTPDLRMDLADLDRLVREDRDAGHLPFCVVASAGTAGTGAVDPIGPIADLARAHNLWLHVDGAYGGFSALAPSARAFFASIGEADSVALDPHKWLYLPVGCGCVLYRDPATARAAFSENADYTRVVGLEQDEAFAFWDYGPELSRPFRALDLWLLLKSVGTRAIGEAIEDNIACAKYFADLVTRDGRFRNAGAGGSLHLLLPARPPGFAGDLDALNERVMLEVQHTGSSYLSNTRIRGVFALRGCVLNYRTTKRDMEILLDDVRNARG